MCTKKLNLECDAKLYRSFECSQNGHSLVSTQGVQKRRAGAQVGVALAQSK